MSHTETGEEVGLQTISSICESERLFGKRLLGIRDSHRRRGGKKLSEVAGCPLWLFAL